MRTIMKTAFLLAALCAPLYAQQATFQDTLLDHMTGKWVLQGTIDTARTTHDVTVEWVLAHQYLQIHEVSREKNSDGTPVYEAIVYIGWDEHLAGYDCLWLDVTGGGGLSYDAIGHAKRGGDGIAFLFKGGDGSLFHTQFVYDRQKDSWRWLMDGESNGTLQPFARLDMTRE